MNLYTIVTADEYELPVLCDVRVREAAVFLKTTAANIRQLVFHERKIRGYKVHVSRKVVFDKNAYNKRYEMTHDRSEYFKKRYDRLKEDRIKEVSHYANKVPHLPVPDMLDAML